MPPDLETARDPAAGAYDQRTFRQRCARHIRNAYDHFVARLSAPPPNDHDSEEPLDPNTLPTPFRRTPTFEQEPDGDDRVDIVVVDNDGFKCYKHLQPPEDAQNHHAQFTDPPNTTDDRSSVNTDIELNNLAEPTSLCTRGKRQEGWHRFIGWHYVRRFQSLSEKQNSLEDEYWRERWFSTKKLTLLGGLWLVLNWVLMVCFARRPLNVFDNVFFYLISPILVFPIPIMIMEDMPSGGNSLIYQTWLALAIWSSAIYSVIDGFLCGYFGAHKRMTCADNDFFNIVYYSCALPAIALFAMHGNRLPSLVGVTVFLVMVLVLIVPSRTTFIRHVIEVGGFHCFFLYANYTREIAGRRVFILKEQMKIQYRSKQKAQIAERQGADSKRRLTNYIFHEVRVPLNTATLAFENIEAAGIMNKQVALEFTALKGSLGLMSKVLSDILDFNKMDTGQLVTVERPYYLHKMLRSMLPGASLVGGSRGIKVNLELDERIDTVARRAILAHHGLPETEIQRRLADPDIPNDGLVSGDEMRMRQVLTNLMSNALKFNVPGPNSRVTLRTKLMKPASDVDHFGCEASTASSDEVSKPVDPAGRKEKTRARRLDSIVVRIEVEDTGVAIRRKDMADNRLFSPFIQTEIGRTQGGKGTGLGLALVRHIVALSGGRLGVISQRGVGSTFWIEMSLGVGQRALREPSWPDIASGTPEAFGMEFPRIPYPSPDASLRNTPQIPTNETVHTPSITGIRATESPTDYLAYSSEHGDSPKQSLEGALIVGDGEQRGPATPQSGLVSKPLSRATSSEKDKSYQHEIPPPPSLPKVITRMPMPSVVPLGVMPELTIAGPPSPIHKPPRPTYIALPPAISSFPPSTSFLSANPRHTASESTSVPALSSVSNPKGILGAGMRILVVDDDLLTRRLMGRMLERLGCIVDTAEDGLVALEILIYGEREGSHPLPSPSGLPNTPDIIIPEGCDVAKHESRYSILFVDNQMPRLTGVELAKRMRQLRRKDFFVGVTGNAMTADQNEYLAAGADHVLTKPVREETIKEMLARARSHSSCGSQPSFISPSTSIDKSASSKQSSPTNTENKPTVGR